MPALTTRPPDAGSDPGRLYPPPPLTRWSVTWRYLLAVAMGLPAGLVYVMLAAETVDELPGIPFWYFALDLGLAVCSAAVIVARRRHPVVVASILAIAMTVSATSAGFSAWAYVSLCTRRRWREQVIPAVLLLGSTVTSWFVIEPILHLQQSLVDNAWGLIFSALWLGIYTAIGWYVGARRDLLASLRERAETAEREQALRVLQVQSAERARLAREMHDSLAHRISLVSLQAGALSYRADLDPAQTREIARTIQETAHEALAELRVVLADLRQDGGPEAPQPTLADLPHLLDETRAAGVVVILDDSATGGEKPPSTLARHAYRIVQEALTNARKHAAGSEVRIRLDGGPGDGLSIEVRNRLTGGTGVPGAGFGLVGLQERAQLMGGTLTAAPERGDFVVRAWLPWVR
ncbi:sensor histidine kinase [Propionicicella superfundia]|uniref:sensor histidine kinase n=1 Tax=Propionicicella superfundia TaxID=348582 RepID=UPI00041B0306|nr:histidine kinase [Propionicicella superfundia]